VPEKRAELLVDPFLYSSDNRYTYTGQEQDEFGGLIYYNARWYDAEVGRFISEDPAAANPNDPLTINRYIYCRNNPLIYTDPTGELFAEILSFAGSILGPIGSAIGGIIGGMLDAAIVNYVVSFAVNAIAGEMERNGDKRGAQLLRNAYTAYVVISTVVNVINAFESVAKTADGVGSTTNPDLMKSSNAASNPIENPMTLNGNNSQINSIDVVNTFFDDAGKNLSGGNQFMSDFLAGGFKGALLGGLYEESRGGRFWEGAANGFLMGGLMQSNWGHWEGTPYVSIGRNVLAGSIGFGIYDGIVNHRSTQEMLDTAINLTGKLYPIFIGAKCIPTFE
jgi:RHS repeat-associated protein